MIRTDGDYTFYQIRAKYTNKKHKDKWFLHTDYYQPEIKKQKYKKGFCPDYFNACGGCWQLLGEFGVFDIKHAREGLEQAKKDYASNIKNKKVAKGYEVKLGIFKITISQESKLIK